MLEKPDAGDIIAQKSVPIDFQDNAFTLFKKMEKAAATLLDQTLLLIKAGTHKRLPQDISKGSYFGGRNPEDGKIDWRKSNLEVYNLVRAVTHPYPGAFSLLDGKKVFIWECVPDNTAPQSTPGEIIMADKQKGLAIAAGKNTILIKKCQLENEPEMSAAEFIDKYNPLSGKILK
jgi:methionyl-tRNA formyltransferase